MSRTHSITTESVKTDNAVDLRQAGLGAFFRPSQLTDAGLSPDQLRSLVRAGTVERVGRGLYRIADAEPTENYSLALVCARVPRGVVCLLSALRVHGIGTQAPAHVWLAIPHKARMPQVPEVRVRVIRFRGPAQRIGVRDTSFEGVPARITSPARTIVDCFRFERRVGPEIPREALDDALRRRIVTIAELDRIERDLPSRKLRVALEARSL